MLPDDRTRSTAPAPVLLLAFNRPDFTRRTIEALRRVRLDGVFISVDGPRKDHPEDESAVRVVRDLASRVNWGCDDTQLFWRQNLGCRGATESALAVVLSQYDRCIVVEDDCVPDPSFIPFCKALLGRLAPVEQVRMIAGTNMRPTPDLQASYRFSHLAPIWGWGTWADRWHHYDVEMREWDRVTEFVNEVYGSEAQRQLLIFEEERAMAPSSRSWGVQWRYSLLRDGAVSVLPRTNLVRNIGMGDPRATRQKSDHPISRHPIEPITFPLTHDNTFAVDHRLDEESLRWYYSKRPPRSR